MRHHKTFISGFAGLAGGALLLALAAGWIFNSGSSAVTPGQGSTPTGASNASLSTGTSGQTAAAASANAAGTLTAAEIYAAANPAVAVISTGTGEGSGFLVDTSGDILTNDHVVQGTKSVRVKFPGSSDTLTGTVIGTDPGNDLAVVHVSPPAGVAPLTLGDSSKVLVGDGVLAIGDPFGLDGTLTVGVVSGLNRTIQGVNGRSIAGAIQTDASINPGNSGGPLLDDHGEVIGINSQLENPSGGGNIGIGFAVPINTAKQQLSQLMAGQTVSHAYLGISGTTIDATVAQQLNLSVQSDLLVASVVPGGPADRAGIQGGDQTGAGGDIIQKADGVEVTLFDQLTSIIAQRKPGDTVTLTVLRSDGTHDVKVTLAAWPNQ